MYTEDNRYGWIDCRNHELKHKTQEACEQQAKGCAFFQGKKYVINRGRLYTCTRAAYRIQENVIPYTDDAFLDLLDDEVSVEFQRNKLNTLLNARIMISTIYPTISIILCIQNGINSLFTQLIIIFFGIR